MSGTLGFGTFAGLQSTQLRPPTSHCSASSMSTESFEPERRIVRLDARGARGESRWRRASITNRELAEFIRAGATRATSVSAATSTNWRVCALGAVYDGVYHLPRDHGKLVPDHLERLFRCLDEVEALSGRL